MRNMFVWIAGLLMTGLLSLFLMFSKKISLKNMFSLLSKPSKEGDRKAEEQGF